MLFQAVMEIDRNEATLFTARERAFVFNVALRYMKDEERAADVAQDAMLLAYQHRDSFRGDARFSTWLYRIAATTALMHLRRQKRAAARHVSDEEAAVPEPDDPHASPEEMSGAQEAVRRCEAHLAEMGDKYGEIFTMRYVDGYSETEIARRLRLHVATVKTRAHRARQHVRRRLQRDFAAA